MNNLLIEACITEKFGNSANNAWNKNQNGFRRAAVLVPLVWREKEWHLLFTRRTDTLHDHKGQVSFPGGAAEENDLTPETTALRETYEEIGIQPTDVYVLGWMKSMHTITKYMITPVIGKIPWPVSLNICHDEVLRVFTIPLNWLSDPSNREVRQLTIQGYPDQLVIYFKEYDGELLWGISAQIVVNLIQALK